MKAGPLEASDGSGTDVKGPDSQAVPWYRAWHAGSDTISIDSWPVCRPGCAGLMDQVRPISDGTTALDRGW